MPPPARSAEASGGPALSDTDYLSSLKLGRKTKKWRQIMVGGGGGGGGSLGTRLMVGPQTRGGGGVEWNRTYLSAFHI